MNQTHISALQSKHAGIDARIAAENQRPHPDMSLLSALKKQKLKIKEEMNGI